MGIPPTSTTPTNNTSQLLVNKELSRVREKRLDERPSRLPEVTTQGFSVAQKKIEIKEEPPVRENTKEKARPSFNN